MSKTFLPGLIYTVTAAAATAKGLFIKPTGAVCGAGETALGVSYDESNDDGTLAVVLDGIVPVIAGGTVNAGDFVKSDANGKAVTAEAGDTANGIALEDGADGATVLVKIVTVAVNPAAAEETPEDPSNNPGQE
ncbi:DUF2190 family protein [bacterium]|nr:DUF2190 family protein [bacterium]MBP5435974.1 DUF2190 family protein [bacterium]